MCRLWNMAMRDYQEGVTTGQTHGRTDRCRTKWSLCAAMFRRQHKNDNNLRCLYTTTDFWTLILANTGKHCHLKNNFSWEWRAEQGSVYSVRHPDGRWLVRLLRSPLPVYSVGQTCKTTDNGLLLGQSHISFFNYPQFRQSRCFARKLHWI